MTAEDMMQELGQKAKRLLREDADKIEKLIEVQMDTLMNRRCPLYEEVLDTQMYGLSREIDFAVRAGLIEESFGRGILTELESNLAGLYEALNQQAN